MRVYKLLLNTKVEGPGVRACIWVQGCRHYCKGCFAEHLWDYDGGTEMSSETVIEKLREVIDTIDGLTLLGGEPFDQATELIAVAKYVKEQGKNVITFSGYTYERLLEDATKKELLDYVDLLCDGPFVEELTDYSRPLLGSSNQRFIYITQAIPPETMEGYRNAFEIRVDSKGHTEINGMGNIKKLKEYLAKMDGGNNGSTNI